MIEVVRMGELDCNERYTENLVSYLCILYVRAHSNTVI